MKVKSNYKELIIKTHKKSNESEILNRIKNKEDKLSFFNEKKHLSVIKMEYGCEEFGNNIIIFGENFVKNNKKKCKIIIKNKQYDIQSTYDKNYSPAQKKYLKILKMVNDAFSYRNFI